MAHGGERRKPKGPDSPPVWKAAHEGSGQSACLLGEGEVGERQEVLVSRPDKVPTHKLCSVWPGPTPAASGLEGATAGEQGPQAPS